MALSQKVSRIMNQKAIATFSTLDILHEQESRLRNQIAAHDTEMQGLIGRANACNTDGATRIRRIEWAIRENKKAVGHTRRELAAILGAIYKIEPKPAREQLILHREFPDDWN